MPTASSKEILTQSPRFCFHKQIFTFSLPGVTCHRPKVTAPCKAVGCCLSSHFKEMQPSAVASPYTQTAHASSSLPACSLARSPESFLWCIHLLHSSPPTSWHNLNWLWLIWNTLQRSYPVQILFHIIIFIKISGRMSFSGEINVDF